MAVKESDDILSEEINSWQTEQSEHPSLSVDGQKMHYGINRTFYSLS